MSYGYFLLSYTVLIEIYPLVPFPPSARKGVSDVTADALRWRPVTSARTDDTLKPAIAGQDGHCAICPAAAAACALALLA